VQQRGRYSVLSTASVQDLGAGPEGAAVCHLLCYPEVVVLTGFDWLSAEWAGV